MSGPDYNRGTGRTTRLVARALYKAATGKRVVFVVYNRAMVDHVRWIASAICEGAPPPTFDITTFQSIATLRYAGQGRIVFYTDHYYDTTDRNVREAFEYMACHA
jgi:hypothetical protein